MTDKLIYSFNHTHEPTQVPQFYYSQGSSFQQPWCPKHSFLCFHQEIIDIISAFLIYVFVFPFCFSVSLLCSILTSLSCCSCPFTKQPYHSTAKFLKTQVLSQIFPVQKFLLFTKKNKTKNPVLKFLSVDFLSLDFLVG